MISAFLISQSPVDSDKLVSILAIAVVTLLILLIMNLYKVHKLKAKIRTLEKI